jgi:hypothetical protein
MAATLNLADGMQTGQTYTFLFNVTGINVFVTAAGVAEALQAIGYLDNVQANWAGNGFGPMYVKFTYTGEGDSVDYVASDIANAVSAAHFSFNMTLATAAIGVVSPPTVGGVVKDQAQGLADALKDFAPSTTTLVLVVAGLALVVFLVSGGAAATREAIG